MTKWLSVEATLPKMGLRVFVATSDGKVTCGKRVDWIMPRGVHWIDDASLPIRGTVTHYALIVAPGET